MEKSKVTLRQPTKRIVMMLISLLVLAFAGTSYAEDFRYTDSWGAQGITVEKQSLFSVKLNYSITDFSIITNQVDGEEMQNIILPGVFLFNDEGKPDLPGTGRYLAIPEGSTAKLNILAARTEVIENVTLAPAPRIPWDNDNSPMLYKRDPQVYSEDAIYPAEPIRISEQTNIRGIDAVMVGITPFQYNPVTKQLIVYRDVQIEVVFEGGSGYFGEDRLRSRWWDPLLSDMLLNYTSLPKIDYNRSFQNTDEDGCEYLIISPTNPEFLQWADSIQLFRNRQGISTKVVTLTEVGGNTTNAIETYVNNAYNTWVTPPAAVMLLGDYGTNAASTVISPIWDGYCASDNIYADVDGNNLPDIVFARITANNATQLQVMVSKFLDYENDPPTNPDFYAHPITALGWQTERWFQICSETIGGFWKNSLGKTPVRINAIYSGTPGSVWSTATNTGTVVSYFGPSGLGYIPQTPAELGGWTGGNATMVNNAINSGSFMLQHRDHGWEQGWGEPAYSSSNINSLTNTDLTFVLSINCLTGKYNYGSEVFSEKFHRHTAQGHNSGALAILAASETSYSFVNDVYVWGAVDNMWPEYMPSYVSTPEPRGILPAFGNAAGKYFLQQSSWPYNTNNKVVTYHLFHHHGDAFLSVYSEVPQALTVVHENTLSQAATTFEVTANEDALIGLTVNGEIIGTGTGTGAPVQIQIPAQTGPGQMLVTVTKQNYYRYSAWVDIYSGAVAMAGDDATICEGSTFTCQGQAMNYTSVNWTTSGTGTFDNSAILNPVYTPGSDDVTAGTVTLTLTATGNNGNGSDDMILTINKAATVMAGADANLCSGDIYTNTDASAMYYGSLLWTTAGDGTFDNATVINPVYTPGTNDITAGQVILTLTAAGVAPCGDVSDDVTLTIQQPAVADAGVDATICSDAGGYTPADATAASYASLLWTTSGDGSFDDNSLLNPVYTPGANDLLAGTVTLTLTAAGNAPCADATSDMILNMVVAADAFAGSDGEVCDGNTYLISDATAANYTSLLWTTSGDGTFDDATLLNASYTPGTQDAITDLVTLTLTATGNTPCGTVVDDLLLEVSCAGIGNHQSGVGFEIYPNPSDGNINLLIQSAGEQTVNIEVLDYIGHKVYEQKGVRIQGSLETQLNLAELSPGLYTIRLTGKDLNLTRKSVIE